MAAPVVVDSGSPSSSGAMIRRLLALGCIQLY